MITLVEDTIDREDIDRLVAWLNTYPRLTKGPVTLELEKKWAAWVGTKHSVFCNSGSSANFLMLHALLEAGKIEPSSKVVVPALAWATDLSPVMQLGLQPILCDINLKDLSVDLEHLEEIFQEQAPAALILVSVLGLSPDMKKIESLCERYNVLLLEDVCESMGTEFEKKRLGSFGVMSSFSTYFGHHISTIEGGFVNTDDDELYEMLLAVRSHGWDRDLSPKTKKTLQKQWAVSEFDSMYTFYYSGLNMRSTDLQAYIGLAQVDKLSDISKKRNKNYFMYLNNICNDFWAPAQYPNCFISNFAYPIIHPNKEKIAQSLINNNVEVRPLICGSMGSQPFYVKKYGALKLPNASIVDDYGMYIPNHPDLTEADILKVCDIVNKAMTSV